MERRSSSRTTAPLLSRSTRSTLQTRSLARNLGGGFLAYAERWGIRGDIRLYDAADFGTVKLNNGPTLARDYTQALLSGLSFWRANLGLAYRW